jgi:hypothetical protein
MPLHPSRHRSSRQTQPKWLQPRRGAVLFEVMLSIALFVGAAAFAMAASRSMLGNLDRSLRQQQAVDLARSKMGELRAGLINLQDLRAQHMVGVGSLENFNEHAGAQPLWLIEINTERSEHAGMTLVELTVFEEGPPDVAARFTLRQLVQLREVEGEEAYEMDDLLEGL